MKNDDVADIIRRASFFPDPADISALVRAAHAGLLAPARRNKGGRPALDDTDALLEMSTHVESGVSVEKAARWVARSLPGQSVAATEKRLARKYRRQFCRHKTS